MCKSHFVCEFVSKYPDSLRYTKFDKNEIEPSKCFAIFLSSYGGSKNTPIVSTNTQSIKRGGKILSILDFIIFIVENHPNLPIEIFKN